MRGLIRLGLGAVALVLAGVGTVVLIPKERVARLAAAEFERLTGRALTIAGPVSTSLWPVLGVTADQVTLANAPWSEAGPMLTAERLAIGVNLWALVGGDIRITALEADGVRLLLERDAGGQANWDFAGAQGGAVPGEEGAARTPFAVDSLALRDGAVDYRDAALGTALQIDGFTVTLAAPDPTGAARFAGEMLVRDQPVTVEGEAGRFDTLLEGGVVPLTATLTAGGSTVGFEGRAGLSPAVAEGVVTADLSDLRALSALAGAEVALPEGLGARVRQATASVTLAPAGSVHLRDGRLTLDGNVVTLAADVTFDGARPKVTAQVETGALVVPGLGGGEGGGSGWSAAPIDVAGLGLADADIAFRADSVAAGGVSLGATRLRITVDRARAVIEALELAAYGGSVTGQFVVNGRSGLSVGGDLRLGNIAMQALLRDLAGYERLIARGDAQVQFLGVGQSLAAIMASLEGSGRIGLGQGELLGLDLLGMLRTLDPGFVGQGQKTIFDSVAASFTMQGGVLRNDDLALAAPYFSATGAGEVGLGAQTIDYRLVPTALTQADGSGGVRVPVRFTGPWAAPQISLDLQALADQELAEERAKLEAELRDRAAEELGALPGESIEDAARRRAQEEAGEALEGLLGGN